MITKKLTSSEILQIVNQLGIVYTDKDKYIQFKCINPSHHDKNPSMTMLKANGFVKCWSCGLTLSFKGFVDYVTDGKSEDILHFSSKKVFQDTLNNSNRLSYESYKRTPERNLRLRRGELFKPNRCIKVLEYLYSLSVDTSMIEELDIRYTEKAEITFADMGKGTLIYNRICVPIIENGKIVNIECRDYTGKQKLKVIYPKGSKADTLWNYDSIDKNKPVYLVEGIKSAFRIYKHITKNVVASLGSAIGNNQSKQINTIKNIHLFPDNDEAGKSMIKQLNDFYDYDYYIHFMPEEGQDPADGDLRQLQWAIDNGIESVEYMLQQYDFYRKKNKKISWNS